LYALEKLNDWTELLAKTVWESGAVPPRLSMMATAALVVDASPETKSPEKP